MPTRRGARAAGTTAVAALVLTMALASGAGQTTGEGAFTACRMGDPVGQDHPYAGAGGTAVDRFAVAFYDADQDGTLAAGEPLYIEGEAFNQTGRGVVSTPDVRWTDLGDGPEAGTHPATGDADAQDVLTPLGFVNFTYHDTTEPIGVYNPGDGIVIDADGSESVSPNDRYLAPEERAGDTVTAGSTTIQAPLRPLALQVLWVDTGQPQAPEDRMLVGDLDRDGQVDVGEPCLSHHVIESTTSPSPTKTAESATPPKTADGTTSPTRTASPSPTTTSQQPGGFDRQAGRFEGRYVTLTFDAEHGLLIDWTVSDGVFFDQVRLPCPCTADVLLDDSGRPTRLLIQANATLLTIHDQPGGLTAFAAFGADPLEFRLAPGVDLTQPDPDTVRLESDGRVAWLTVHAEATVRGQGGLQRFSGPDGAARLVVHGTGVSFVSNPGGEQPLFERNRERVDQAILDRRLTAQVQVLRTDRGNEPQVLAYEEVRDIQVRQPAPLEYEIEIDADFPEGRAFLFQFPRQTLPAETLELRYLYQADAEAPLEVRTMVEAATLDEVLEGTPAGQATYHVETTPDGFQVAVAVPEFSIQLFQVLGVPPETAPIFAYGVALVFLFLGVGVVGVMIGRRGRPKWKPRRKEIVPVPGL